MAKKSKNIIVALLPLSRLYGAVTALRNRLYDRQLIKSRRFGLPVICVGNLTVGGTGKTPHTEYLIALLQRQGKRVAVLSRGYRRRSRGFVTVAADTPMSAAGDEPCQMKRKFPAATVAVDANRCRGIERLTALPADERPQVVLLDDAYQHRAVQAGLNILLVNYRRPIWDDAPFPAGRLREGVRGKERADVVIVTKCPPILTPPQYAQIAQRLQLRQGQQLFFSTIAYGRLTSLCGTESLPLQSLAPNRPVVLLTGIAHPAPLQREVERYSSDVTPLAYPDHHYFTPADIARLQKTVESRGEQAIVVTTEKDATRLTDPGVELPPALRGRIYSIGIEVKFLRNQEQKFCRLIMQQVEKNQEPRIWNRKQEPR